MRRIALALFFLATSLSAANLTKLDGFIPLYWDEENGKLLMEPRFGEEMIYQTGLPAGLGSNPVGLDRGELSDTRIVKFVRVGPKVLLIQLNDRYRAMSLDANERRAVEESFAQSVLGGFKVEPGDGPVRVDASAFFLRDAHGVIQRLKDTKQGSYKLDEARSAIYLDRTKSFPKNTEVEATLTFATDDTPGPLVRSVTPTPSIVTVREHHSFIQLPEPGYVPRELDPRVGYISVDFYDYATPFTGPVERHWIARHRLTHDKPIIYYVDSGAPEPIRSALIEGASWWSEAFAAAGYPNSFQVKVLPDDADPMDVRYNVIHWVHRSTRGWSYGESITDPRTGEILKGNVRLGSLRIRQDYTIGSGLVAPDDETAIAPNENAAAQMALARIRQLAAHEVGHTLGLDHNMAASTYDRASVMDYPSPLIGIKDGKLDLSNAYTHSIGAYDKWAIRYGYADLTPDQLHQLVEEGVRNGMLFVKDSDARPVSAAHPLGSVWDNGSDPVAMLRHEIEVRRIALANFGLQSIPVGTPLSMLEAKLVPLYLHHRYQLESAAKSIGGVYFTYAVKTANGVSPARIRDVVPLARQRDAIEAVVSTLDPKFLAIPDSILKIIPPPAHGFERGTAELFDRRNDPVFTPEAAAVASAEITLSALFDPQRAARMNSFAQPPFREAVDAAIRVVWKQPVPEKLTGISRAVRSLLVTRLMDLAADANADPGVRATATDALRSLRTYIAAIPGERAMRDDIERFLERPYAPRKQSEPPAVPPGPPIG